jgi:hypothetical protein
MPAELRKTDSETNMTNDAGRFVDHAFGGRPPTDPDVDGGRWNQAQPY